jgi:hypothetical protein
MGLILAAPADLVWWCEVAVEGRSLARARPERERAMAKEVATHKGRRVLRKPPPRVTTSTTSLTSWVESIR